MKLSIWFPHYVLPAHIGVYEVDDCDGLDGPWYAYWDGKKFGYRSWIGPDAAYSMRNDPTSCRETAQWRGLAEPPKKAKAK